MASNPAPKAKKRTTAQQWKQSAWHEVEVPSGHVALVRRTGMQAFLKKGVIPNSLMPMVQKAIGSGEFDIKEAMEEMDADKIQDIVHLYDAIVLECVIEPHVEPTPTDEDGNVIPLSERAEDHLYVDEVDFEDKVFLFQWVVGGTHDVEQFREQQNAAMAAVSGSQGVVSPPIHADRD